MTLNEFTQLGKDKSKEEIETIIKEDPVLTDLASRFGNLIDLASRVGNGVNRFLNNSEITGDQIVNGINNFISKTAAIKKDVEVLENTADSRTRSKLNSLLNQRVDNLDDFHQKIKDLMNYNLVYQNPVGNAIIHSFNQTCIIDINLGKVQTNKITYIIDNFDILKSRLNISTSKLLLYAIQKIDFNNNIAEFTFTGYCHDRQILNDNKNRLQLKSDLLVLRAIGNITYSNTKKDFDTQSSLITDYEYDRGYVKIWFNPRFTQGLKESYMHVPTCLLRVNGKENANLFMLGYYLFTQIRIENNCEIKRSIKNVLSYLKIPSYEVVKSSNRAYQERIIEPFEKLIDGLNDMVKELNIQFEADYKNINDFIDGYILISLKNKKITENYTGIKENKKKKSIKHNTEKREININLTKKYLIEGKDKKEMAILLNVSPKTVNRYLDTLDKRTKK